MRSKRWFVAIVVVSFVVGAASPASAQLQIGLTEDLTLTHDSELRTYDVLRPGSSAGAPAPLIVDLHGLTSTGDQQRSISGWSAIAEADGLLVAWPDGLDQSWNGGICCGNAVAIDRDDVGFIRAMVGAIQTAASVDPNRIYVTGLSNGGAMSHRLACDAPDLFAAAAPMAFPVPYLDFENECQPSEAIPILFFMGFNDVLVNYLGAAPSFAAWRDKQGCDSAGAAVTVNETYGGSDCAIDTSCGDPGVEVGLCSVTGTEFPDPPLNLVSGHILYFNDDALNISQRAWDFMRGEFSPPSLSQQKCISALNKSFAKVAKAKGKLVCGCIKDHAKGKLAGSLEACLIQDPAGKVAKATAKTLAAADKKCAFPFQVPIGPQDPDALNAAAIQKELDLIHDVFGTDLDVAIKLEASDKEASKCQQTVAKSVKKCQDAMLKEFNLCKKLDLKADLIVNNAGLESCASVDSKGKIAKACAPADGKIRQRVNKSCSAVDLEQAFPGCDSADPLTLAECLERVVRCRTCQALNQADSLGLDCDAFDGAPADSCL